MLHQASFNCLSQTPDGSGYIVYNLNGYKDPLMLYCMDQDEQRVWSRIALVENSKIKLSNVLY